MTRLLIIIIVSLLFVPKLGTAQEEINKTDSKGRKQGVWVKYYEGTKKKRYKGQFKDDVPFGKFEYYYDTGETSAVSEFKEEGKVTYTKTYYPNGGLMAKGKYIDQIKDSVWWYFTEDKKMLSREFYLNGKLSGEKLVYYPTDPEKEKAIVRESTLYKDGLKNGQWTQYTKSGTVSAEGIFVDGNYEGKVKWYFSNGKVETEGFYRHAVKNGFWKTYDEEGEIISKVYYLNGKVLEGEKLEKHLESVRENKQK